LSAPDDAAGKMIKCPKPGCGAVAAVPHYLPAEEVAVVDAVAVPAPKSARTTQHEAERPRQRPRPGDDDDDDDDRPRPKRKRSAKDDDDYEFDHSRRRPRRKSGMAAGAVVAIVLGSIVLLGGIGYGIYALVGGKGGLLAKKAPPPGGWKQFTYAKDGFKAFFPSEPSVGSMDGFGGFAAVNMPGANMPGSFSIYIPRNIFAPVHASVIVVQYRGSLSSAERNRMRDLILQQRGHHFDDSKEIKSVRWLGVDADEVVTPRNLVRIALVGNTLYMAEIGADKGRASAADENGFFDNFELVK